MAAEIDVWNPSFDVTPFSLIEGIITEHGMLPRAVGSGAPTPGASSTPANSQASRGPFQAREFLGSLGLLIGGSSTETPASAPGRLPSPAGA